VCGHSGRSGPETSRANLASGREFAIIGVMDKHEKLYRFILLRRSDANVPFDGLCQLMNRLGFRGRIKGDHHIFTRGGVQEILNLQPKGSKAKPYQVKQVRNVILRYGLTLGE